MKAYLDLNTGSVHEPPFRHIFSDNNSCINGNKLPINKQLYFLNHGDTVMAYAPYERFAALIDEEEHEFLLTYPVCDRFLQKDLIHGKFYGVNENYVNPVHIPIFSPTELTVFLGDACNLSCVYCNAVRARNEEKFNHDKTISAVKIILEKYPIKHISFFGNGEPLLYFRTFKDIVTMAESQGIKSFYIVTNGVLGKHTKDYVKYLVNYNIYTQISIDGYEEIHNLQRPMQNGTGSFEYVMQTINEFKKYGDLNKYCFARFTLSEYASKHLNDIILFLFNIGFRKIRFAELVPEGRADEQTTEFTRPPNPLKIVDKIVEVLLLADELRINVTGDYDSLSPSEAGVFPCPYMGGKAISLNKNLKILSCLEDFEKWVTGEVNLQNQNVIIDKAKLTILQKRNMLTFDDCESCPVKCGGGCTHYSYLVYKSLNIAGDYREKCRALRLILGKYLIAKLRGDKTWRNIV
jgi:radical SAM protein with 4Fe4S-binding SPASM domain